MNIIGWNKINNIYLLRNAYKLNVYGYTICFLNGRLYIVCNCEGHQLKMKYNIISKNEVMWQKTLYEQMNKDICSPISSSYIGMSNDSIIILNGNSKLIKKDIKPVPIFYCDESVNYSNDDEYLLVDDEKQCYGGCFCRDQECVLYHLDGRFVDNNVSINKTLRCTYKGIMVSSCEKILYDSCVSRY